MYLINRIGFLAHYEGLDMICRLCTWSSVYQAGRKSFLTSAYHAETEGRRTPVRTQETAMLCAVPKALHHHCFKPCGCAGPDCWLHDWTLCCTLYPDYGESLLKGNSSYKP